MIRICNILPTASACIEARYCTARSLKPTEKVIPHFWKIHEILIYVLFFNLKGGGIGLQSSSPSPFWYILIKSFRKKANYISSIYSFFANMYNTAVLRIHLWPYDSPLVSSASSIQFIPAHYIFASLYHIIWLIMI